MAGLSKHFWEDTLAIIVGLGTVGAVAVTAFLIARSFGFFSYTGLTTPQVQRIMQEIDTRWHILTRSQGTTDHSTYYRGIYVGGDLAYPMYYKYELFNNGTATVEIYPTISHKWSSADGDPFNLTGTLTYPPLV